MISGYINTTDRTTLDLGFEELKTSDGNPWKFLNEKNELIFIENEKILWKREDVRTDIFGLQHYNGKDQLVHLYEIPSLVILTNKRICIIRQPAAAFSRDIMSMASYTPRQHQEILKGDFAVSKGLKEFILLSLDQTEWTVNMGNVISITGSKKSYYFEITWYQKRRDQYITQILFAPFLPKNKMKGKYIEEAKLFWREIKHGKQ